MGDMIVRIMGEGQVRLADSHLTELNKLDDALALVLMVLGALALVFRRRAPRTVLALTGTVSLVECIVGDPRAPVAMSAVIALYTVAASTDRPTTWRLGLLTMTVLTGA